MPELLRESAESSSPDALAMSEFSRSLMADAMALAGEEVKPTGLAQSSQVCPAVLAESPYKSLSGDPDSGSSL